MTGWMLGLKIGIIEYYCVSLVFSGLQYISISLVDVFCLRNERVIGYYPLTRVKRKEKTNSLYLAFSLQAVPCQYHLQHYNHEQRNDFK